VTWQPHWSSSQQISQGGPGIIEKALKINLWICKRKVGTRLPHGTDLVSHLFPTKLHSIGSPLKRYADHFDIRFSWDSSDTWDRSLSPIHWNNLQLTPLRRYAACFQSSVQLTRKAYLPAYTQQSTMAYTQQLEAAIC